jgi:hypothetical protein
MMAGDYRDFPADDDEAVDPPLRRQMAYRLPIAMSPDGRRLYEDDLPRWTFGRVGLLLRVLIVIAVVIVIALAGSADWPNQ